MDKPYYPYQAIGSIELLARTLGISSKRLISIASRVDNSYAEFELHPHPKTNKIRTVFDPKYELKKLQKRINSRIFEKVQYPKYLQGGIKAPDSRDYVENAKIHSKSNTLISLDIKNFYPNIKEKYVYDIFKQFLNFPDEVSKILTTLTTYKGFVPQGAVTSSYIANLIFFNSEYSIVSALRTKGVIYSRLLDDVSISSEKRLNETEITKNIKFVVSMFTKYDLKLNTKKTKKEYKNKKNPYEVTGLWVGHAKPKARKLERRYIRQLVYNCELKYPSMKDSSDYHELWNKSSGLVAKLERLGHSQAKRLRARMSSVLPCYDDIEIIKTKKLIRKALKVPREYHQKHGHIKIFNKLIYRCGILSRTHKKLSKHLRQQLQAHYQNVPTIREYWHG
ncbi:reverse transcriptase family protein [Colwellia sp. D2M02]|uniref:reverse transcriptase family protein n=1 Tax=Colwellia sp. D2M02 TaxID=2841562 RepID=UPI001C088683|nr:reverse transcriptase family protein [Colwellia sp. D2M02]MBU2893152.1 reverse transcriptase family protein [Colwellia sp. D2M02]